MKFLLLRSALASVAVGGLAFGAMAASAGAGVQPIGAAPLTVIKTVSGPVPAGTTFSATVQCGANMIFDGASGVDSAVVQFDATGQPTTPDIITFRAPGTCTVTETVNGGAATTAYSCVGDVGLPAPAQNGFGAAAVADPVVCPAAGPQATPITVNIIFEGQTATVTIANTVVPVIPAPPATPAAQVVIQPAFTG
ncbi:MAG: hypothetical protein QOF40_373 [Actinomycetota bacterium]|nr:hypothetical protein [Actinomycetota bacterium]